MNCTAYLRSLQGFGHSEACTNEYEYNRVYKREKNKALYRSERKQPYGLMVPRFVFTTKGTKSAKGTRFCTGTSDRMRTMTITFINCTNYKYRVLDQSFRFTDQRMSMIHEVLGRFV